MDNPEDAENPITTRWQTSLKDGQGRPSIKEYSENKKFRPNDEVRIKATASQGLRGPFKVSEACDGNKYILEMSDGAKVDNGKEFNENEFEFAK